MSNNQGCQAEAAVEKCYQGLSRWLSSFSPLALERLTRINQASSTSRHIILALTYGIADREIRQVNRMIIGLMLCRHKAVRRGDAAMEAAIEIRLKALHRAVNEHVGPPPQGVNDVVCRSVSRNSRTARTA